MIIFKYIEITWFMLLQLKSYLIYTCKKHKFLLFYQSWWMSFKLHSSVLIIISHINVLYAYICRKQVNKNNKRKYIHLYIYNCKLNEIYNILITFKNLLSTYKVYHITLWHLITSVELIPKVKTYEHCRCYIITVEWIQT